VDGNSRYAVASEVLGHKVGVADGATECKCWPSAKLAPGIERLIGALPGFDSSRQGLRFEATIPPWDRFEVSEILEALIAERGEFTSADSFDEAALEDKIVSAQSQ
jgi:hypothetical protein